jgi:hypothetical protein
MLAHEILCNLHFPLITIAKKLLLIIQEFFMRFSRKFVIGSLHNGIDRTGFLTESTIDAFGHVNIIPRGPTRPILSFFGINGNGLGGTYRLAKLAGDATFFSGWVASQGVFAAEARTEIALFVGVVDGHFGFQGNFGTKPKGTKDFGQEKDLRGTVQDFRP